MTRGAWVARAARFGRSLAPTCLERRFTNRYRYRARARFVLGGVTRGAWVTRAARFGRSLALPSSNVALLIVIVIVLVLDLFSGGC
jgi:hypothetical protein